MGENPGSVGRRVLSADGLLDPVRGGEDPPVGEWLAEMALELVQNAELPPD